MNGTIRVGNLFGIPFYVARSWFFVLALVSWSYGSGLAAQFPPSSPLPLLLGLVTALLLFASVLAHELGHSFVALRQGIGVKSITLFLFGGLASLEKESETPAEAFNVAIAGPLVSLILFGTVTAINATMTLPAPFAAILGVLAYVNLSLALFNLIPGLPLDGGQVLKAAVWKATGNRFTAVHWAARAGVILGWSAIAAGLAIDFFTGELITGLWIALLGWFGIRNTNAYNSVTSLQEILLKLVASDAISSDFRVIDADQSLRSFADSYLLQTTAPEVYFAASEGRYRGVVSVDDLRAVERSEWENKTLHDILHPLTEVPSVTESTPLVEVIEKLETQQLPRIVVLSPADAVAGIIDRGDIVRAVGAKLNKPFSDADIKRVKDDGSFPPTLQLGAIAKSTKG